jgi:hypothetical protein
MRGKKGGEMFRIFILICLLFAMITLCPAATGDTRVTTWFNDATAAYSLTFDDFHASHFRFADSSLTSKGLVGTFGIIVSTVITYCTEPGWNTCQELKDMQAMGHEVCSHTYTHPRLPDCTDPELEHELLGSMNWIDSILPDQKCLYLIFPGCAADARVISTAKSYGYISQRGCTYEDFHRYPASLPSYDLLRSSYANGSRTADNWNQLVDSILADGGFTQVMLHSVNSNGFDNVPLDVWEAHTDYVAQKVNSGELWQPGASAIIQYARERDEANVQLIASGSNYTIEIGLTDTIADSLWFHELTLITEVPSTWDTATVYQGGVSVGTFPVVNSEIMYNVVPDAGLIGINEGVGPTVTLKRPGVMKNPVISVWPNPFRTSVGISVSRPSHVARHDVRLEVFNIVGKMVANIKSRATSDERRATSYSWDASKHPGGVYFVHVQTGNQKIIKKINLIK